ncbi:hypothetical protein OIU77_000885 [Salix suchowensis]|uniref:Uncharacterized protein n=1 Tax=Salix suchowensis TaxID=1278906 RepID=A0ABQ9B9P3_9ROSI|nr:hypothetical protein OIU77_000885 [Salix suchowensis]
MSSPSSELVSANPSFTFIPLPRVSPPTPITSFLDLVASFFEIPELNNPNLHQTLLSLSASSNIKALTGTGESKKENECLTWLDSQPSRSVLYSVFLVEEMKAGLAVKLADEDGFVSAAELEERVTELMNSNKGEAVRERVRALREAAVVAKSEGGSAHFAMERLVNSFK